MPIGILVVEATEAIAKNDFDNSGDRFGCSVYEV